MTGRHEAVPAVVSTGLRAYTKLFLHVLLTLGAVLNTAIDQGGVVQWLQVLAQGLSIAAVYVANNTVPGATYAKSVCSAIGAALSVAIPALLNGGNAFSGGTLVNMILAVVGTLGVYSFADLTPEGQNVIAVAKSLRGARLAA